ncbi:MAG TPA: hypothetical protein VJ124_02255 [Pyrinomonadaceae bacterium]|nr:hypothetical protein [Pyrinomonadaceae bacterium]
MKKGTKRLLRGLAVAAGGLSALGAILARKKMRAKQQRIAINPLNVWARPGMKVFFRAELMPGREREERAFRVKELLPSGRVLLDGVAGEHAEREFEPIQ